MGKPEFFDKSSIPDNLTGVHQVGAYDRDADKTGTGVGSSQEEAAENAQIDLEAQKVADKAEEYLEKE